MTIKGNAMVLVLVATGLGSAPALAAETGGYFGLAAGQSMADMDAAEADAAFASVGITSSTTTEDTDVGFKIFGGYRFNRYLAVEAGYTNFGKFTGDSTIISSGGSVRTEAKAYSINASALGILPLNESFEFFGRAGVSLWDLKVSSNSASPCCISGSTSESGASPLLGIGATFNAASSFSVRVEFERHFDVGNDDTTGTSDIDLISVGALFRF